MWLHKDERRLLEAYYLRLQEPDKREAYVTSSWIDVLRCRRTKRAALRARVYGEQNDESLGNSDKEQDSGSLEGLESEIKGYVADRNRLAIANSALRKRGMITITAHQTEHDVVVLSLTMEGYDLGRKYSNWFTYSGLWFEEYRNHWIWLIVSFFAGILGGILVSWVSR